MMQSIQALKNAVIVLGKHHAEPEALMGVASVIKHHMGSNTLKGTMSPTQTQTITAFIQQPAGFQSYAPASATRRNSGRVAD